jgi:lysozyme
MTATPYRTTGRPARTPSKNCERFLHAQEGLARRIPGDPTRVRAYQCPGGVWTIGYGSTAYEDGSPVREGDVITVERAQRLFANRLRERYVPGVLRALDDRGIVVDQSELDALVSLCYNIGPGSPTSRRGFYNSSVVRALARGDREGAATAFLDYRFAAGQELRGLRRRRELEAQMFLFGPDDEGGMFDQAPAVEQAQTAEGIATARPILTRTETAIAIPAAAGAASAVSEIATPVAQTVAEAAAPLQDAGHALLSLSYVLPILGTIGALLVAAGVGYGIYATLRARRAEAALRAVQAAHLAPPAAEEQASDVEAEPLENDAQPPRAVKRAAPARSRSRSRA